MPYYSAGNSDSGVLPVLNKNLKAPTPPGAGSGDPIAVPDFITQAQQKLADIRNELSDLLASRYGGVVAPEMSSKTTVDSLRKQVANNLRRDQLEEEESAIVTMLNNYLYTGTLGDYETQAQAEVDAEAED